jgi:hypothetical protein
LGNNKQVIIFLSPNARSAIHTEKHCDATVLSTEAGEDVRRLQEIYPDSEIIFTEKFQLQFFSRSRFALKKASRISNPQILLMKGKISIMA